MKTDTGARDEEEPIVHIEENGSTPSTSWTALFNFTEKSHLVAFIPGLLFSIAAGILQPAMAIFFGKFFDAFSEFGAGKIDGKNLIEKALRDAYALVGIGGATWLLKGGHFTTWLVFGELQAKSVRDELFQGLLGRDLTWYEMRSTGVGSLLSRLQTQIRELQIGTSQPLGFTVNYVVQAFASLGLSFYYSWKLTLVIMAGLPPSAIVLAVISTGMQSDIVGQEMEMSNASKVANDSISQIEAIKCFNSQRYEGRRYANYIQSSTIFYLNQAFRNALQIGFVRFVTTAMFVQGFYYGGHLVHEGKISAGSVVTTFWACLMATKAFEDILPNVIVLEKGRAAAIALRSILDRVGRGRKAAKRIGGLSPEHCEGDIEMRNISFAYPSRPDHLVLQESTFFFPSGETTFIVGKSGSGKSTLGNLLMRFYAPENGTIFIDGQLLDDLDMNWLRNNITLVQQQSLLFNETIFRNISFGRQDYHQVSQEDIKKCLDVAALRSTVEDLPAGVNTMVGAGGSALSGGQKQRVAIARARLRDTPVLILDESTSSLDYASRTSVMEAIRDWRYQKTTIIITHDISQIQDDDFVYVLEEGNVLHEGYWHNVADDLKTGLFASHIGTPRAASTGNFDFGFTHRSASGKYEPNDGCGSPENPSMAGNRKDSLDVQLEMIAEGLLFEPRLLEPSNGTADRSFSKRLTMGASNLFDTSKEQTSLRRTRIFSQHGQHDCSFLGLQSQRARSRTSRPMSYHQAIMMTSIYRHPSAQMKPLPTPAILNATNLVRRSNVRKPAGVNAPLPPASIQSILTTVWPSLTTKHRVYLLGGFFTAVIHAAGPPGFSYILVQLFSTFYEPQNSSHKALVYSMAIFGVAVADGVACFFMHYLLEAASQAWIDHLCIEAMRRILDQPKAWFDDSENSPNAVTSALDRNAEEMRNLVGRFAAFILVVATMMSIAVLWSFFTCWKVTLVGLASAPVLYCVTKSFERVSSVMEARTNVASDEVGAVFGETFSDIRTVRALTLESYLHRKYTLATSRAFAVGVKRALYSGFFFGMSDSAINFVTALVFWFGAFTAKSHAFPVKSILTSFSLLLFSTANANAVISYIPQISSSADTASRLLRLAKLPLTSHEHVGHLKLDRENPQTLGGPISFINLTFYYPTRQEIPALQKLNLTIPSGQCTAIVGASGSGKSTIANLLLGMYPPSTDDDARTASDASDGPASLTLSGRDIRTLNLPVLRSMISVVPQTPVLFSASVRENIIYGLEMNSKNTTDAHIQRTAQRAGIHDFIRTLPQGYDTLIGEGGLGLSGGQAQRVVIARALVRQPRILILDEATSALDPESAQVIRESVLNVLRQPEGGGGRGITALTVIIITHTKDMMECADNVVVLDRGSVVEEGSFRGLLRTRGRLWQMLNAGDVVDE